MSARFRDVDDSVTRMWIDRTSLRENQKDGGDRPAIFMKVGTEEAVLIHEAVWDGPTKLVTAETDRPFEGEGPHVWVETDAVVQPREREKT